MNAPPAPDAPRQGGPVGGLDTWLRSIGLERYAPVFAENEISLDDVAHLTEADVDRLGLPVGPRRRLLVAIAARKVAAEAAPSAPPADARGPAREARPGAERRQLTVMFCDLVGSTALAEQLDPEELRDLIRTYRQACAAVAGQYDGHVAQFLGDGLMVYFGWPIGHEDAAERGVRSALEIVRAVREIRAARPLSVRVGLATGSVVVGDAAHGDALETRLAVGEAPNLAARLQSLARPDEVVIAAATRRLLGDAFVLVDNGTHALKGIAEPVRTWRVEGVRRTEGRFEAMHAGKGVSSLVGREAEMALLLRLWQEAKEGRGQVVLVAGEPGIGKSRLSQGLRERIVEPHVALRYQCSPYHLNSALYPFVEQLEFAAGFAREDAPERRLVKLEGALAGDPARVAEAAPLLAALLSLPTGRYPAQTLSPQRRKEETLKALSGQIEAMAAKSPVLILFEDLHWVDPTSLELLDALVPRVAGLRVLLVATHRPEHVSSWTRRPGVSSLALSRLDRREAAFLVAGVTKGKSLPPEVFEEIVARTDGVPLFVEELTQSIVESGLLKEAGDRWTLSAPLPALAIPTTLRDSLAARLDRLASGKEVAQIGACIGRDFSYELLSRVTALPEEGLRSALARLAEAGLIAERGSPPNATYLFKHALVQDAAYDSLLKSRRSELHATIARALERHFADQVRQRPESLAHHHTLAGNAAAAIPLWRQAGALAIGRVALQEALAHLGQALDLIEQMPPSAARDDLELSVREQVNAASAGLRGWAASEIGVNTEAILRLAKARGNARSLLLGLWWMWTNTITQGRIADSLPWAQRLLAEGREAKDVDLEIFGLAASAVSSFFLGRLAEASEYGGRVLALYDPKRADRWIQLTGHDLRTLVEVWACQWIWMLGRPDEALKVSERGRDHARDVGHAFNLVWALTYGAYAYAFRREPERLRERIEEADRLAREQGIAFIHQVTVPQIAGLAELHAGRPREASAVLRKAIDDWTNLGGGVRVPLLKSALAEAVALEGDPAAALRLLGECLDQIERPGFLERVWRPEVLRLKGWVLARLGRDDEAEAALRDAVESARGQGAKAWELRSATTLATLLDARGRRDAARDALAPVCSGFTEGGKTRDLVEAHSLLARLSR